MDTNVPTPLPLIQVDLNHEPHEFFFPDHSDQYLLSRYMSLPQSPPHQGISHHPGHAYSVGKLIITPEVQQNHSLNKDDGNHDIGRPQEYRPVKWMSSKMRIMKKMTVRAKASAIGDLSSMIPPRPIDVFEKDTSSSANSNKSSSSWIESNSNNHNPTIIRVCADCNTMKTPLWRSGPTGPKTLCNACGIRQRKARRALAAAAAAANGESLPQLNPIPTKVQQKKKRKSRSSSSDNDPQPMKKVKTLDQPVGSRNLCFEEFVLKLSEWISDFRGVVPQDEKEAAILLMALSYGLVQADNLS